MGNDYGCICSKDSANISVPGNECKIDPPEIIENAAMRESINKAKINNYNPKDISKIIKIQSHYLRHFKINFFKEFLKSRVQLFDTNVTNFGTFLPNSNDPIGTNTWPNVKQIENSWTPFIPSNSEITWYHYIFQKETIKFKSNNALYKGGWNYKGQKHGYGIFIDNKGTKYNGFWYNDELSGRGRLIDENGSVYDGFWKNGKANGKGILKLQNGYIYDGSWWNDMQNGLGKEMYNDGSRYEGNFENGKKSGDGKYFWDDKSMYIGKFQDGEICGKGKLTWKDGRWFSGEWSNNAMNGKGEFNWTNGKKYIGEYKNNKKEGFGTYYWSENVYYEGYWLNNWQHGEGEYVENGNSTKGVFRYGKLIKNHNKDGKKINEGKDVMKKTMNEYMQNAGGVLFRKYMIHSEWKVSPFIFSLYIF